MVARAAPLLASVLLALLVIHPADAAHCTTYSTTATDLDYAVVVVEAGGILYYPITYCRGECQYWFSANFIYFESNGIPGLQRADVVKDDTCHGMIEHDFLLN